MPTGENENRLCSVRFLQPRLASSPLHVFHLECEARRFENYIANTDRRCLRRAMPRSKTTNRRTRVGCVLGVFFPFPVATDLDDWCLKMSQVFSSYSIRHFKTIKNPCSYTGDRVFVAPKPLIISWRAICDSLGHPSTYTEIRKI